MKTSFVYVLKDPTTHAIRYVGVTNNPNLRLKAHIGDAIKRFKMDCEPGFYYPCKTKRSVWIRELLAKGLSPYMDIIMECPGEAKMYFEGFWYQVFLSDDLVNGIICSKNTKARF